MAQRSSLGVVDRKRFDRPNLEPAKRLGTFRHLPVWCSPCQESYDPIWRYCPVCGQTPICR